AVKSVEVRIEERIERSLVAGQHPVHQDPLVIPLHRPHSARARSVRRGHRAESFVVLATILDVAGNENHSRKNRQPYTSSWFGSSEGFLRDAPSKVRRGAWLDPCAEPESHARERLKNS